MPLLLPMPMMSEESVPSFQEETRSTIEAMQRQEKNYACHDYCRIHEESIHSLTLESDRKLMLKWSYNVVDYFNLNRETVAIAMSLSDRFLATDFGPEYLRDTDKYQLMCIVCLYIAIKVHESASISPKVFVDVGRGQFTLDQMVTMERTILKVLNWRVNPPTALGFVRLFLNLIPSHQLDLGNKATVYMLARAQTERAMGDYQAMTIAASLVAYVSVHNSLKALRFGNVDALLSTIPMDGHRLREAKLTKLRMHLFAGIAFESSLMNMAAPPTKTIHNAAASTKTKDNNNNHCSIRASTTPRSVLCHP